MSSLHNQCLFTVLLLLFNLSTTAQNVGELLQMTGSETDTTVIDAYNKLTTHYAPHNFDSASYYARKAINMSLKSSHPDRLAESYSSMGTAFDFKGVTDTALFWFNKSLDTYASIPDTSGMANIYLNIGVCYHYGSKPDSALSNYLKTAYLKEKIGSTQYLGYAFNNIGMLFRQQKNYPKSLDYYKKSLALKQLENDQVGISNTLGNIGSLYQAMEKYDSAHQFIQESLKITQELGDSVYISVALNNLSTNFSFLGNHKEAYKYQKQALAWMETNAESRDLMHTSLAHAKTLFALEKHEESMRYFEHSYAIASKLGMLETLANINGGLSDLHLALNHPGLALSYYKKAESINDLILDQSKAATIEELEEKYQSGVKEKEIALLEIEKQKSTNQRNIFVLIAAIVVIALVFLFILLRSKSKANSIISRSLGEKEILLKEIHHRVKNNLQVVSSLLSLQSRYIEDEKAKNAVNEGQNRVKSMALIHQKLYQEDNLTGVEAKDYIQQLTATLKSAYHIDSEVAINFDIDEITIDVDTIIPLGLIMNELISNVFKHAFSETKKGDMLISLKETDKKLVLQVNDNGKGMEIQEATHSFGMRMIRSLSLKLEADISFIGPPGTKAILMAKNYKLV